MLLALQLVRECSAIFFCLFMDYLPILKGRLNDFRCIFGWNVLSLQTELDQWVLVQFVIYKR